MSGSSLRRAARWALRRALALVVLLALGYAMLPWLERKMIYFPSRALHTKPDAVGLPYEDVAIRTADGVELHAWFIPASDPAVRRAVLFLHGNAGNIADRVWFAKGLHTLDAHVLLPDYRGFGRSLGEPGEQGLYEDGMACLAALRARPEVDAAKVVAHGRSLGGGVAAEVARRDATLAGVILESSFTSIPDMAAALYPIPGMSRLVRTRFDNLAKVARLGVPLHVVHGDRDEVVPFRMGQALAEAGGVELQAVVGAHHNDTDEVGGAAYLGGLRAFLDRVAPP